MNRATCRFGAQHVGEIAYFNVFAAVYGEMEAEIEKAARKSGITIVRTDEFTHDRGWMVYEYKVTSCRAFDPRVDAIADGLHALSAKLFRETLPGTTEGLILF